MEATEVLSDAYFTPAEVAVKLRLKVGTVRKHIREGRMKATNAYRRRLVPSSEVVRFLQVGTGI